MMKGESIVLESGHALLRLLPVEGAAKERAEIRRRIDAIAPKATWVTPIIVPLTASTRFKDLLDVGGRRSGVEFDLSGDAQPAQW